MTSPGLSHAKPSRTACTAALLAAFNLLNCWGAEVLSVSIGADWAPNGIVPWEDGVTEATVVMSGIPDPTAVGAAFFLVGRFAGGAWNPRTVTALTHLPGRESDTYRLTFHEVAGESVLLVVVAGPTTGLNEPHVFSFGHLTGDVNGDGFVSGVDSLLVIEHVNSNKPYDPRYDVDRNGSVSGFDSIIINRVINGPPENRTIIRTEPVPPQPTGPPGFDLLLARTTPRVILLLTNFTFGFEYSPATSLDLTLWQALEPVIASTAFGERTVKFDYPLHPGGRAFFRVGWLVRPSWRP